MYCKYCGQQIDDNAQFCPYCGKQLQTNDGHIKKKSNTRGKVIMQPDAYDNAGDHKRPGKKRGKRVRKITAFIMAAVALVTIIVVLTCLNIIRIPVIEDLVNEDVNTTDQNKTAEGEEDISLENYWNEPPDAEAYFEQNSQIIEKMDINDSKDVLTEAEVVSFLEERGFKNYPITTAYSMDGKYHDEAVVSNSSDTKHPVYETYYVSSRNEYWIITVIEQGVFANPVSFNMQTSSGESVIFSESNTIISYDSGTNQFYKIIPYETVITVKVVDRIDAKTLEEITIEAIGE